MADELPRGGSQSIELLIDETVKSSINNYVRRLRKTHIKETARRCHLKPSCKMYNTARNLGKESTTFYQIIGLI